MEIALLYTLVIISGLFIGSFLNVVADRSINGEPIIKGRSHCETCSRPLGIKNLIPLLSFLFQKGKCAFCGSKLSWYYPASELITGLAFGYVFYISKFFSAAFHPLNLLNIVYLLVIVSIFIVLFLTDIKYLRIPDLFVYSGVLLAFVYNLFLRSTDLIYMYLALKADDFGKYLLEAGFFTNALKYALKDFGWYLISALAIAMFFWALVFLTKERGMGRGDIGLGLLVGLFNGFPSNILATFLGFVLGAVISLVLVFVRKKTLKDTVPFGPFLLLGSLIALGWGTEILKWYVGFMR